MEVECAWVLHNTVSSLPNLYAQVPMTRGPQTVFLGLLGLPVATWDCCSHTRIPGNQGYWGYLGLLRLLLAHQNPISAAALCVIGTLPALHYHSYNRRLEPK